ncbi:MAG: alginate export family protein [Candidatus Hydrogenedentes bacterium]|nr:alginate export family protein [Candidatus Hydrogenedentota bacterium]
MHHRNVRGIFARFLAGVACMLAAQSALAELQNVDIGGELRMRYRYYRNVFEEDFSPTIRIPGFFLPKRPIGAPAVVSLFDWDGSGGDWHFSESAVLLNVSADFTDNVSSYIELYDYHEWGEDFRSDYLTGADSRATTGDDVEVNQAYIQVDEMFGTPLRLRVGRQALVMGKGWLVNEFLTPTQRLSFDALRLTYDTEAFTVDAFASKVLETGISEQDGDVNFYGVYATYKPLKALDISAYWYWLRDARSLNDTNDEAFDEWIEDLAGRDNYDATNLHTVGVRLNGALGAWDYDLEAAYQFGEADAHGARFVPIGYTYGDDDAEYDNWGADLNTGYTFDVAWSPRVSLIAAYFGGHDNRDLSFIDWINPFYEAEASVSFNRLFADKNYLPVVNDNGWLSNFYMVGAGVDVKPTDAISAHVQLVRAWITAPFDPPATFTVGKWRVPLAPALSFWTDEGSDDIGWEASGYIKYNYSDNLYFLLYYSHLFPDDGLTDGGYFQFNGTGFSGGSDTDDADYVFLMSVLKF